MGLALVLVIAVIRQAGNPKIYEAFFPASPPVGPGEGIPRANDSTPTGLASAPRYLGLTASGRTTDPPPSGGEATPGQAGWSGEFESLTEADARRMYRYFVGPATEVREQSADPLSPAGVAASAGGADRAREREWLIERFADPDDPAVAREILRELDRWAIRQVDPAAVWKGVDTLAFYRLMDPRAIAGQRDSEAVRAGVISLLQQPEVYLRRRVLLPGRVVRAIRRDAKSNPFGVAEYWELWLRPEDGSERPWVLFTSEVPPAVEAIPADQNSSEGPSVWAEGMYLKRLAYRSTLGSELAPAIVGVLHSVADPVEVALPAASDGWADRRSAWVLLAATVVGGGLGTWIFVHSVRTSRRASAVRRATLGDASGFLKSLSVETDSTDVRGDLGVDEQAAKTHGESGRSGASE
ncbi:MAG: hypothetical protein EA381_03965 [Planctomycetaceae bacterium]|nr:MAG: hypothetical protein EA381_03965 [Planctomycetaceae bacterium]